MFQISTIRGRKFAATNEEPLLDAAIRAGITIPYSCRTGRCSTCKCKVKWGKTIALYDEIGLTASERANGWILGCVRKALSDVELEVEDLGAISLPLAKTTPCRIQSMEQVAIDVMKICLRLPPAIEFNYYPGQYIDLIGHGGLRRSYSIANATVFNLQIELHIRQVESGTMSSYVFERAKVNDLMRLNGPLGTFFLRDVSGLDLVFLATGTGIAPIKAMLEGLKGRSTTEQPRSITLFWGGRTSQDLYLNPQIGFDNLRYVPVLSRPIGDWRGARGHVQNAFLSENPVLEQTVVYACGSEHMVHKAREALFLAGLAEQRFYADAFVCSAAI